MSARILWILPLGCEQAPDLLYLIRLTISFLRPRLLQRLVEGVDGPFAVDVGRIWPRTLLEHLLDDGDITVIYAIATHRRDEVVERQLRLWLAHIYPRIKQSIDDLGIVGIETLPEAAVAYSHMQREAAYRWDGLPWQAGCQPSYSRRA